MDTNKGSNGGTERTAPAGGWRETALALHDMTQRVGKGGFGWLARRVAKPLLLTDVVIGDEAKPAKR